MKRSHALYGLIGALTLLLVFGLSGRSPAQAAQSPRAAASIDCSQVVDIPQAECEALVAFYEATGGPNWSNQGDWLVTNTACAWYGIVCASGHVVGISLSENNLVGAIPPEIENLTSLAALSVGDNRLTSLPAEIGALSNLVHLYVYGNQLTSLPVEIAGLSNLTRLRVDENQLTSLPGAIGSLSKLTYLSATGNQLTSLPPQIGNLTNLESLILDNNRLASLPAEIGTLSSLSLLALEGNRLPSLPAQIGNLTNLSELDVSYNQLTSLPTQIGSLTNLVTLDVSKNLLTSLPPQIGNLANLTGLYAERNRLTSLPPQIGNLTNLEQLRVSQNELTALPAEIGGLANLQWLEAHGNPLDGPLPSLLTSLNLDHFSFYNTAWCVPNDANIQNWLATISDLAGTGLLCGEPAGGLGGTVMDADGTPLPGAQVILYRDVSAGAREIVAATRTDEMGRYGFDGLGQEIGYYVYFQDADGLLAPEYHLDKARLQDANAVMVSLGVTSTIDARLDAARAPLVSVEVGSGSVTTSTNQVDGVVAINVPLGGAADLTLSAAASCSGGDSPSAVALVYRGKAYPMTAVGGGLYRATIPTADVEVSDTVTLTTTCNGGQSSKTVASITLYDPTGMIVDATTGAPVVGAKVTLHQVPGWLPRIAPNDTRPNTCESTRSKSVGALWSQPAPTELGVRANPEYSGLAPPVSHQYTNDQGYYGWDAPEGCWYVTVEAEGYEPLVSPLVGVRPSVTNLNLALTPITLKHYLPIIIER